MDLTPYVAVLERSSLLRGLSTDQWTSALAALHPYLRSYAKKAPVFQDGSQLSDPGILLSGHLQLFHLDANGNKNLMDTLNPGDCLGLLNAVGGYALRYAAVATQPSQVLYFRIQPLLEDAVLSGPVQLRLLQNLTLTMAQTAQQLTRKLEDSIRHTIRQRLQDYLSAQYHQTGSRTFVIPLNRQDLADFLFVDRSAMSNELCKMREEGLLKFEKSRFHLLIDMPITEEDVDPPL